MPLTLKPSQLKLLASRMIEKRKPLMVVGPPGCGKTAVIGQAAADSGVDVIVSHPVTSDQTKAEGMPWVFQTDDGPDALFIPIAELKLVYAATRPTLWFIDDLGQAGASVQASFMGQIHPPTINGKRIAVNGRSIPECVTIMAATNRRTDKAGVSGILEPVKGRFTTIVEMQPDLDEWCTWAMANGIPAIEMAYLRFRPDSFSAFAPSADMTNSPTARGWEHVADLIGMNLPRPIFIPAAAGAVGEGAALEYVAFEDMYKQLPSIEATLLDPDNATIPDKPNVLYAVTAALASKVNEKNFGRIGRFAERLNQAGHGEFSALLIRDCGRRDPKIQSTVDYVRLMSGELGQMLAGTV